MNRLDNLKNSNPLYKDMDDEQILTTNYNLYYKDKLSYDSFKQQMTQPLTIQEQNKIALRHYQEKQNITQEDIQNYLNYKETEELKSKGKIGFLEGFTKNNASDFIPFADYVVDGVEAKQMRDIISRAYKGETLTQEETQKLRQFNKELKEDEVRGYTILGSLSSNIGNIFRVPMEFWITGGVAGGLGIGAKAGASLGSKITTGLINAGTYTALQSPTAVYSAYQSRQLANMLKITDKGEEFFNKMDNAENFSLKELFKATGDVYVSNLTEMIGGELVSPLMNKMLPFMKKASQSVFNDSLQNVVSKMGWNGFVEEVFEEWLEQPLRFAIGLEDDKYTLENFLKSMKMSSDEFLITIGAVAIQGGSSYATAQLYNKLVNKGVDKDKALNHLSTMTEKQKVNYLQQLEKYETEQDTQWYNDYINQLKNDFVKQGETQERVENNLKLLDNVFIRYAINQGTSRKDIVENLILKSNNQNTRLQELDNINKKTDLLNQEDFAINKNFLIEKRYKTKSIFLDDKKIFKNNFFDFYNEKITEKNLNYAVEKASTDNNFIKKYYNDYYNNLLQDYNYFINYKNILDNLSKAKKLEKYGILIEYNNKNIFLFDTSKAFFRYYEIDGDKVIFKKDGKQNLKNAKVIENKNLENKFNELLTKKTEQEEENIKNRKIESEKSIYIDKKAQGEEYNLQYEENKKWFEDNKQEINKKIEELKKYYEQKKEEQERKRKENQERYESFVEKLGIFKNIKDKYFFDEGDNFQDFFEYNDLSREILKKYKTILKKEGYTQYNTSKSGTSKIHSLYFMDKNGNKIRLSDHELPMTAEREYKYQEYGKTFAVDIVINHRNFDKVLDLIKQELSAEDSELDVLYQTAYHGSPYNFDKFTLEHIGEGEGVQAHGYGLYFALNKEIEEGYKNTLSKTKKEQGKLYEVEIPNDGAMLFEDKSIKEQSKNVKDNIKILIKDISISDKLYNELKNKINDNTYTGNDLYNDLSTDLGSDKLASELLNMYGIQGIRYNARRDGECAVVFNDKAISIIEKFNQQQNKEALAQIQFKDTEAIITIFENANASSLTHEMGHYFLRLTQALANSGNVVAQKDLEAIRKWLKNDGSPFTREQEELFARSYEGYLRRGIAPSSRLQEVFNKLSEWLRDVYKSIKELNINLSSDVIDFFDNYLSYDIDTSNAELQNQINNLQSQMDEEVNTLMQDGMDYNTAYDLASDKYQERIDRIKQELQDKSRSSKDYDFNKVVLDLKEQENNKLRNYINSSKKAIKDWSIHSLMTTENILKNLAPDLYYKMSKYYASLSINKSDTFKKLEGFFNKLNNIEQENTDDYYILWSALYNRFNDKIQELLDKYNLYDDYIQVREILDDIRLKALSVGVDVGYLENYFPRSLKVDTRNEFLEQLRTDKEGQSIANDILYNLELIRREKGSLDPEQEARYINNFLRGYVPRNLLPLTVIDNLRKPRNIDIIQPQFFKYFEKPQVALHRYVSGALEDFYKRQLLGMENQDIAKLRRRILDLRRSLKSAQETSAGKIKRNVDYKLKFTKLAKEEQIKNLLKKDRQDFSQEEKDLLIKLNQEIEDIEKNIEYNEEANAYAVKNKRIKDIENEIQENFDKIQNIKVEKQEFNLESSIGYLLQNSDTLQNLKQDEIDLVKKAITSQLNPEQTKGFLTKLAIKTSSLALLDITNSVNQLKDFANSFAEYGIKNAIKSINSDINIKIEDLGINDIIDNIQQDRWKFLDKMLKLNGLVSIDTMFANQQIRAQFLQTQELLKNNDIDTLREIELFFGNEAQDVINNLKELKNLDDSKIREWAYFKLSQLRPLNSGSKTLLYLTSGRLGRIAYILKNYAIKQLNLAYSRVYKEALNGNYKKATTYGTELFLFTLFIAGSIDSAKDLIWGMIFGFDEEPEKYITDAMIDNIILFNLIGRYNVSKVSNEGIGTGFFEFMFMSPLVSISNDIYKDVDKLLQGDLEIQDVRTIKYLPFGKTTKKILKEIND